MNESAPEFCAVCGYHHAGEVYELQPLAEAPRCALPELRWPLFLIGALVVGAAAGLVIATWRMW